MISGYLCACICACRPASLVVRVVCCQVCRQGEQTTRYPAAWSPGSLACKDVQKTTNPMWWPRFGFPMAGEDSQWLHGVTCPSIQPLDFLITASEVEVEVGLLPAGFARRSFAGNLQIDQRQDAAAAECGWCIQSE
jgi:hypothetical protein